MGQVRWVGWTMAIATALVISGGRAARADVSSDKPAAILIYPKIYVDSRVTESEETNDTVVRLTNTNASLPILAHCFYVDANSHCSGGSNDGGICTDDPSLCTGGGFCVPTWQEIDFHVQLTANQPIQWKASEGLADDDLPLPVGVCVRNPSRTCGSDSDCNPFPGGTCTQSNQGTRIPPVPEDPFIGELKCIAVDENGAPVGRNDLKGEAIQEEIELEELGASTDDFDISSYNAIGIQATGAPPPGATNELVLGGPNAEYNGCPNYLILNHFFYDAENPVPGSDAVVETSLVLVPCSQDLQRQIPGTAVAQYLVFNEFEQRFSTSKTVRCFQNIDICNIDTPNCDRSIFNVSVAGTLTGQTRIQGVDPNPNDNLGAGLLGVAVETHTDGTDREAAFNLHMQGARDAADLIVLP